MLVALHWRDVLFSRLLGWRAEEVLKEKPTSLVCPLYRVKKAVAP